jgi:hypothetical protein
LEAAVRRLSQGGDIGGASGSWDLGGSISIPDNLQLD